MSYAVFKDGDRISRPFRTQGDARDCANDAGLVENVPSGGGSVQVLDSHCTIEPCDGEPRCQPTWLNSLNVALLPAAPMGPVEPMSPIPPNPKPSGPAMGEFSALARF
jgi:hypothetical protein